MAARQRNPRRIVADALRPLLSNVRIMTDTWDGRCSATFRPEDYRERWEHLADYMNAIRRQAEQLEAYARDRAEERV